ncbi:hypothetical protein P2G88_02665 [Aliiglaciecola sp. CAU 1673]|uniref:hypothetical protein n=1 Tax=Aliiglaciecola sp. CAU 1673 TaxID=3032595 RepID=UPI0023DBC06C|nr:hypothetical protein [Aliiglaciecola sp. CAU 1673]MDF2177146.1 hypothetical protein [Aliiglaciecola sp. CAU 1673]
MTRWVCALSLLCLSANLKANAVEPLTKISLSYLEHPSVVTRAIPIVRDAYQALGIELELVAMPASRLISSILQGQLDGDVVLAEDIFYPYPDIIAVGPPLSSVTFVLLCQPRVDCTAEILGNPTITIASTDESYNSVVRRIPNAAGSHIYKVNYLGKMPELVASGHFDYAFYVMSNDWPVPEGVKKLKRLPLFESYAYHVLHKKHADLVPRLHQAIANVLASEHEGVTSRAFTDVRADKPLLPIGPGC